MIYPSHLEAEVKKYCDISGIRIVNGNIPSNRVREVEQFLRVKTRMDRIKTRRQEELSGLTMNLLVENKMKTFTESPIEEFMYKGFIQRSIEKLCVPQMQIGTKRVDFAFPVAKLVVECDGKEFHFTEQAQIEKDQKRDQYLAKKGWRVLHIEGLAIRRNIDLCMDRIMEQLNPFIKNQLLTT